MQAKQREIEELVKLSYQALDTESQRSSKIVFEEGGWGNSSHRRSAGAATGRYSEYSRVPDYATRSRPLPGKHTGNRSFVEYDDQTDAITASRSGPERRLDLKHLKPVRSEPSGQATATKAQPEVRFTLPHANLASDIVNGYQQTPPDVAKGEPIPSKIDTELKAARLKLDNLNNRQVTAEKAKDWTTASDLKYYAIPDQQEKVERLEKQQREEQGNSNVSANVATDKPLQTEVETESEGSDEDEDD